MSDTGQFVAGQQRGALTDESETKAISDADAQAAQDAEQSETAKTPGKAARAPGKIMPPSAANSCDAAADFLRKMAKYR